MKIDPETRKTAKLMKTIGEPSRFTLIKMLLKKPAYWKEMLKKIKSEPPTLSHHLKKLRELGVVDIKKVGKTKLYFIAEKARIAGTVRGIEIGECRVLF